uniref:DDE Tnp4 domain-containing protein n=1 Tax=Plectus sambesii TaxID=2011161 RepID=A0A914X2W5_9BILA
MARKQEKVEFLKKVLENKAILFGKLSPLLRAKDKENCWERLRTELIAEGSALAMANTWKQLSTTKWQHCRRTTLAKVDKRRQSGAAGPLFDRLAEKWDEVDDIVYAILGKDSAIVNGLDIPETGEEEVPPKSLLDMNSVCSDDEHRSTQNNNMEPSPVAAKRPRLVPSPSTPVSSYGAWNPFTAPHSPAPVSSAAPPKLRRVMPPAPQARALSDRAIRDELQMSSSESDDEVVRRPRVFRERINFVLEPIEFRERFRLTMEQAEQLLTHLGPYLGSKSARNKAMPADEKLLGALRFFASGHYYYSIGDCHGYSKATVTRAVHRVTKLINSLLFQDAIKWPDSAQDRREIGRRFYNLKSQYATSVVGMPSVCGAVDGTLVNVLAPKKDEHQFVDRHGNHSLNCTAVAGPNCEFYFISAKWPGSVSDCRVLRNSALWRRFEADGWRPFPGAVLLGDSIYPTKEWLIPMKSSPPADRARFYAAHAKARRVVECAFGILKMRFRCLFEGLRVKDPVFACEIIKACAALHNLVLKTDPVDVQYELDRMERADGVQLNEYGLENEETTEDDVEIIDVMAVGRVNQLILAFNSANRE